QIAADNVTLDMGGHTITYNVTDNQVSGTSYDYLVKSAMGVKCTSTRTGMKILNGKLIQGEGYNSGSATGYGYSLIHVENNGTSGEIAGITGDYIGQSVTGIRLRTGFEVHHNVIKDRGTQIENRHQGNDAMKYGSTAYNNLVKRCRQRGLTKFSDSAYHNEIYGDSWYTNSLLLSASSNTNIYGNHIFGGGYMVVGLVTNGSDYNHDYIVSKYVKNVNVYDNFVHMQLARPFDDRSAEYGPKSGGHPGRGMWGMDNVEWYNNILVSYAKDGGETRGLWLETQPDCYDNIWHDNIVKTIFQDDAAQDKGFCVSVGGRRFDGQPIYKFEDNVFIGNHILVTLGESY
ncbi:hypothetical protein LCGC14_3109700, partial [marine sediment metagenome]